jgi:uncharacterized protein YndB with AHSA1/START domain
MVRGMVSRHASTVIHASRDAVYAFARDPAHLTRWAAGLAEGDVEVADDERIVVGSPMGRVEVVFAPHNEYGVLDHDVTLPGGLVTNNPFRVLVHPEGSEVVFTVRQGDASEEDFARDVAAVQRDLETLKSLVEG